MILIVYENIILSGIDIGQSKEEIIDILGNPDSVRSENPIDFDYRLVEDFYYGRDHFMFIANILEKYSLWGDKLEFAYERISIGSSISLLKERFPSACTQAIENSNDYEYILLGVNILKNNELYDDAVLFYVDKKTMKVFRIEYWFPM